MKLFSFTKGRIVHLWVALLILLCVPLIALAQSPSPGLPFEQLQNQVNALQDQLATLQSQLDAYTQCIEMTMNEYGEPIFVVKCEMEAESDLLVERDLVVIGQSEHEGPSVMQGDTDMLSDASVQGNTDLDQTNIQGTAEIEGDASVGQSTTVEGQLVIQDRDGYVDENGVLYIGSSAVVLQDFGPGGALLGILPTTPLAGTDLSIQFAVDGKILPCSPTCGGARNILIKDPWRPGGTVFTAGSVLNLRALGVEGQLVWREVSRSSNHFYAFDTSQIISVGSGQSRTLTIDCVTEEWGGIEGAVMLFGQVEIPEILGEPAGVVHWDHYTVDLNGNDRYSAVVEIYDVSAPLVPVRIDARCLAQ